MIKDNISILKSEVAKLAGRVKMLEKKAEKSDELDKAFKLLKKDLLQLKREIRTIRALLNEIINGK